MIIQQKKDQLFLEIQARMCEITDFDYLLDMAVNISGKIQKDQIIKCIAKIGDLETELIKVSLKKKKRNNLRTKKEYHRPL